MSNKKVNIKLIIICVLIIILSGIINYEYISGKMKDLCLNRSNDFVLVFITYSGLCNQFYDINAAIAFCLNNNIKFTFKYASLRNDNLVSWYNVDFDKLFDTTFLKKYDLYIDPSTILIEEGTDIEANKLFINIDSDNTKNNDTILNQMINFNKKYIILKQFWAVYWFNNENLNKDIIKSLLPSKRIMDKYIEIRNKLFIENEQYNFIHYRYEVDFINHFNIHDLKSLSTLINNSSFKNNSLKIYIATSNIRTLLESENYTNNNIVYKNDSELEDFNFEEKAFIDYMFGINATEVIGHSKSSFSVTINDIKNTRNFYDI